MIDLSILLASVLSTLSLTNEPSSFDTDSERTFACKM